MTTTIPTSKARTLPSRRPGRSLLSIGFAGLVVALVSCTPGGDGAGGNAGDLRARNAPVVLISIDTLRSDRLPMYGYDKVETPALDALAADSIVFDHAYAHVPLTLPSHSSLLTGLLPPDHGVRDNAGYRLDAESMPSLPAALQGAGYSTAGVVSTYVLRGSTGIDYGFDSYEDSIPFQTGADLGGMQRSGRRSLELAQTWLDGLDQRDDPDAPWFLFFHIYEPHTPWTPPEPFKSRYDKPYDGEVAEADRIIGELLDELRRRDDYDDAIIILVSDHGEGLGDHGAREHGVLLYREAIQVPLVLKLPGARHAGSRVDAPSGLTDVLPTVLGLLDLPIPEEIAGTSLLDLLAGTSEPREIYSETFYPRIQLGWSDLASLVDGRFHYIEGPDPELYDLTADPAETKNLLQDERRAYARLREALSAYDRTLNAPNLEDAETREQLAALGYLGGGSVVDDGPLPDPKSQIHILDGLRDGFQSFARGRYEEAVPIFQDVTTKYPKMLLAWERLAQSLQRLGRLEDALAAYRKALEVSGGSGDLALATATVLLQLGEPVEALDHAELGLGVNPSLAHEVMAQAHMRQGDLDQAAAEARQAIEADSDRPGPRMTLGEILIALDRPADALVQLDTEARRFEADQDKELLKGLHFLRGDALSRLERAGEAEAAFRREISRFPDDLRAYNNLAVLLAVEGRGPDVGAVLREMVDTNPSAEAYAEAVRTLRIVGDDRSAAQLLAYARSQYPRDEALRGL